MTSLLAAATDFAQASPDSSGKKLGMKLAASGLYLPASVIVDEAGNTIDGAVAGLAGTERGLVTRALAQVADGTAVTASITTATGVITATGLDAFGSCQIAVSGTYGFTTTPPTYIIEASPDAGTTWQNVAALREDNNQLELTGNLPANTLRSWLLDMHGFNQIRLRFTAWGTPTGTIAARVIPSGLPFQPAPAGQPTGKVYASFSAVIAAGVTTEGMFTLTPNRAGVNGSTGTSFAVTTGKRLRITHIVATVRSGAAAVQWARFLLRHNPSGAAIVTSPIVTVVEAGTAAAVSGNAQQAVIELGPDGPEFTGTDQIGISHIDSATTNLDSVYAYGYEY